MPQHGPAGNVHNLQVGQQEPFVPTFFDSFQNAFGVDNARTRQLQALRAGTAAGQFAPDPNFLPQQPRVAPGAPGLAQPIGRSPFFGDSFLPVPIDQLPGFAGDKFSEGLNFLKSEFAGIPSPTDVKVQQALEAAGVPGSNSAIAPQQPGGVQPQSAINPGILRSFAQQLRNFG